VRKILSVPLKPSKPSKIKVHAAKKGKKRKRKLAARMIKRKVIRRKKGLKPKKRKFLFKKPLLKKRRLKRKKRRLRRTHGTVLSVGPVTESTFEPQSEPEPEPGFAKHEPGVNLIGYIRTEIGLGEACRLMAKAFESAELPFGIINFADSGANSARNLDMTWVHKEIDHAPYKVNFFHMNAPNLRSAFDYPFHPLGRELFNNHFNIGYWAWELSEFPDEWCSSFELVQEVWTPSSFIMETVQKKSPVPVIRIPHAIEVKDAQTKREWFGLPNNQFLFLSMYDTHSIKERKNPQASIQAFKKAFKEGDPSVGLVIKVNNPDSNPRDLKELRRLAEGYSNIYFILEILDRRMVDTLINSTDCFVSLHRSEGFGLVLAEAMYLGKPVIGTNWSGNTDFMNEANSCAVDYSLIPIVQDIGPYKADQIWADPDIEHAAYFMRKLVKQEDWRRSVAQLGQETIHTHYSPSVIGQMSKQRLKHLGLL
jgi:glycosyltransferase involved in cell wall biosynthesis